MLPTRSHYHSDSSTSTAVPFGIREFSLIQSEPMPIEPPDTSSLTAMPELTSPFVIPTNLDWREHPRWRSLVASTTPTRPPLPADTLVPDPSPRKSSLDGESEICPETPKGSFIHRRRRGEYIQRPPVWNIQRLACDSDSSLGMNDLDLDFTTHDAAIKSGKGSLLDLFECDLGNIMYKNQLDAIASVLTADPVTVAMAPEIKYNANHGQENELGPLGSPLPEHSMRFRSLPDHRLEARSSTGASPYDHRFELSDLPCSACLKRWLCKACIKCHNCSKLAKSDEPSTDTIAPGDLHVNLPEDYKKGKDHITSAPRSTHSNRNSASSGSSYLTSVEKQSLADRFMCLASEERDKVLKDIKTLDHHAMDIYRIHGDILVFSENCLRLIQHYLDSNPSDTSNAVNRVAPNVVAATAELCPIRSDNSPTFWKKYIDKRSTSDAALQGDWAFQKGCQVIAVGHTRLSKPREEREFDFSIPHVYTILQIFRDEWAACVQSSLEGPFGYFQLDKIKPCLTKVGGKSLNFIKHSDNPAIGFLPLCAVTLLQNYGMFQERIQEVMRSGRSPEGPYEGRIVTAPFRKESFEAWEQWKKWGWTTIPSNISTALRPVGRLAQGRIAEPYPNGEDMCYGFYKRERKQTPAIESASLTFAERTTRGFLRAKKALNDSMSDMVAVEKELDLLLLTERNKEGGESRDDLQNEPRTRSRRVGTSLRADRDGTEDIEGHTDLLGDEQGEHDQHHKARVEGHKRNGSKMTDPKSWFQGTFGRKSRRGLRSKSMLSEEQGRDDDDDVSSHQTQSVPNPAHHRKNDGDDTARVHGDNSGHGEQYHETLATIKPQDDLPTTLVKAQSTGGEIAPVHPGSLVEHLRPRESRNRENRDNLGRLTIPGKKPSGLFHGRRMSTTEARVPELQRASGNERVRFREPQHGASESSKEQPQLTGKSLKVLPGRTGGSPFQFGSIGKRFKKISTNWMRPNPDPAYSDEIMNNLIDQGIFSEKDRPQKKHDTFPPDPPMMTEGEDPMKSCGFGPHRCPRRDGSDQTPKPKSIMKREVTRPRAATVDTPGQTLPFNPQCLDQVESYTIARNTGHCNSAEARASKTVEAGSQNRSRDNSSPEIQPNPTTEEGTQTHDDYCTCQSNHCAIPSCHSCGRHCECERREPVPQFMYRLEGDERILMQEYYSCKGCQKFCCSIFNPKYNAVDLPDLPQKIQFYKRFALCRDCGLCQKCCVCATCPQCSECQSQIVTRAGIPKPDEKMASSGRDPCAMGPECTTCHCCRTHCLCVIVTRGVVVGSQDGNQIVMGGKKQVEIQLKDEGKHRVYVEDEGQGQGHEQDTDSFDRSKTDKNGQDVIDAVSASKKTLRFSTDGAGQEFVDPASCSEHSGMLRAAGL